MVVAGRRRSVAFFIALGIGVGPVAGQTGDLRAELIIQKERYCEGGGDTAVLQLECTVRYVNAGREPMIVSRGGVVWVIALADTEKEQEHPKYRWEIDNISSGGFSIDTPRPGPAFAILEAGKALEFARTVPIVFQVQGDQDGLVQAGSYSLQVVLGTWDHSAELEKKLRERWKKWGYLWTDDVKSVPISVTIDGKAKRHQCD